MVQNREEILDAHKHQNIYKTLNLLNKMLQNLIKKYGIFTNLWDFIKNKNISFNFIYDIDKKGWSLKKQFKKSI